MGNRGTLLDLDQRPSVSVVIFLELVPKLIDVVTLFVDLAMRPLGNNCVGAET
jgi:hypothetical protein